MPKKDDSLAFGLALLIDLDKHPELDRNQKTASGGQVIHPDSALSSNVIEQIEQSNSSEFLDFLNGLDEYDGDVAREDLESGRKVNDIEVKENWDLTSPKDNKTISFGEKRALMHANKVARMRVEIELIVEVFKQSVMYWPERGELEQSVNES